MVMSIVYPPAGQGRGSFSTENTVLGGTLNLQGTAPGRYYRAPANEQVRMPGLTGARAVRTNSVCNINDYAVFMFIKYGIQPFLDTVCDGILGPKSAVGIVNLQKARGLSPDGIIGPKTCRMLQEPFVITAVSKTNPTYSMSLFKLVLGTLNHESEFDGGAVGVATPHDVGVGQINEVHSTNQLDPKYISLDDRLNPEKAIPWVVGFVDNNYKSMNYDLDLAILAYNLGISGAWEWNRQGRPQMFRGRDTFAYLERVKVYQQERIYNA